MISQIYGFVNEAFALRSVRGIGWCLQNEKHPFGCFVLRCVGKKDATVSLIKLPDKLEFIDEFIISHFCEYFNHLLDIYLYP